MLLPPRLPLHMSRRLTAAEEEKVKRLQKSFVPTGATVEVATTDDDEKPQILAVCIANHGSSEPTEGSGLCILCASVRRGGGTLWQEPGNDQLHAESASFLGRRKLQNFGTRQGKDPYSTETENRCQKYPRYRFR